MRARNAWSLVAALALGACSSAGPAAVDAGSPDGPASPDQQLADAQRQDSAPDAPRAYWRPDEPCLHAHNDYEHARPLFDALDHGACSVEADVFLVAGELAVAHELAHTVPGRTLEALYLEPLRQRIADRGGSVYGDGMQLLLLVDLKSEAVETWRLIEQALQRMPELLTRFEGGERRDGPLLVLLSGNRPLDVLRAQATRLAAADGRLAELDEPELVAISPLVSDDWNQHILWQPALGELPAALREKLTGTVKRVHDNGQLVRFWNTADLPAMWQVLVDADVDLLSVDDLAGGRAFLDARR